MTSPFSDPDRSITSFTEINVLLLSKIKKKTVYITVLIKITHFVYTKSYKLIFNENLSFIWLKKSLKI